MGKAAVKTSTSAVKRKEEPKAKATPKAKTSSKPSVKDRVLERLQPLRSKFNSILNKVKSLRKPRKKAKKLTKAEKSAIRKQKLRGIIGIGLLFVVVSIAYSTYMTVLFVDGPAMVAALVPQCAFAVATLFYAFYNIFK